MVYDFSQNYSEVPESYEISGDADKNMAYWLNYAIKKVSDDIGERFNFNTAISTIMELVNEMYRYKEGTVRTARNGRNVGAPGIRRIRSRSELAGIR